MVMVMVMVVVLVVLVLAAVVAVVVVALCAETQHPVTVVAAVEADVVHIHYAPRLQTALRHNREGGRGTSSQYPQLLRTKSLRLHKSSQIVRPGAAPLGALAMDYGRAGLVVLVLGDPHLLERRERGHDGAADPDGVLALRGSEDLDVNGRGREPLELQLHARVDV